MLQLFCPHCGEHREEEEFHYKGQAHIARPTDPDGCSDQEWGEYLYFRKKPREVFITRSGYTRRVAANFSMSLETLAVTKYLNPILSVNSRARRRDGEWSYGTSSSFSRGWAN